MADNHRPRFHFILLHLLCSLHAAHAHGFDFPTGGLSTGWRITPSTVEHAVNSRFGSQMRSPLLRRNREGSGPSYACGFYCLDENYGSVYFAIFIVQANSSGDIVLPDYGYPQVVWVANRGRPVGEKATVHLGSDGDLVLRDMDGTKVWSTNTSGKFVTGVNLTEYGNLVLFGGDKNETIWDSFDYPTNTLVPGQKLRIGQSLKANADFENQTEGIYYLSATSTGLMAFSEDTDPPTRYACILLDNTTNIGYFVFMNGSISTSSSGQQYMPPSQFLRLDYDGSLAVYEWNSTTRYRGWDTTKFQSARTDSFCAINFYPTAGLSNRWTSSPRRNHVFRFDDGSSIIPVFLRHSREGFGPTYACGFYCREDCKSSLFSIFIIRVNNSGISLFVDGAPQVVWTANRSHPVGQDATLELGSDGNLMLMDMDGTNVWSTNTSGKSVTGINLTDSGNLVLFGGATNQTIWESFPHPTDTMVPGQKLLLGQMLTSDASANSSTEGLYYLNATSEGLIPFITSKPPLRYGSPVPSVLNENVEFFELVNGYISTSSSGQQMPLPTQFLRLQYDGHLRVYEWSPSLATWDVRRDLLYPTGRCYYPTVCGRYGVCSRDFSCRCLQWEDSGLIYFVQVDGRDPNSGCKLITPLSCQSPYNHTLMRLENISYFSYGLNSPDISGIDEGGCRNACEKECSCKAAFYRYDYEGKCYLVNEVFSLIDDQASNSVAFVKVQNPYIQSRSRSIAVILAPTLGALFLLIPWCVVGGLILKGRMMNATEQEEEDLEQVSGVPKRFSLDELRSATDGFSKKLGEGGFGSVYEGRIDDTKPTTIAVKRLDSAGQGRKEFLAEVQTIGKIDHINLVKLIGYCAEKSFRLLVYEFMPNGSLDRWIFSGDQNASLDWETRCKIILGVAKGLCYLHEECSQRIAHLDIKPQNILLDDRFDAKISDFGLAKLFDRDQTHVETRMRGTRGYLAPEWLSSKITEKVDVYSFGVVVLEIICGRRNLDRSQPEEDVMLVSLLKKKAENNELLDLVDERIKNTHVHNEQVMKMMKIAMWCLQDQSSRPSMSTVVKILEGTLDIESNLEDTFWTTSILECNGTDHAGISTPMLASVLSEAR